MVQVPPLVQELPCTTGAAKKKSYIRSCFELSQDKKKKKNLSPLAVENSLALPQKVKPRFIIVIYPAITLLGIYPKEMKTHEHIKLYTDVQGSITHNSQKVEVTQTSINQ